MVVAAFRVVKHLGGIKYTLPCRFASRSGHSLVPIALQQLEETLDGIVASVHAAKEGRCRQRHLPVGSGKLALVIGMHQHELPMLTLPNRHQ